MKDQPVDNMNVPIDPAEIANAAAAHDEPLRAGVDLAQVEADVREEWSRYSRQANAHLINRATEYTVMIALFDEMARLRAQLP